MKSSFSLIVSLVLIFGGALLASLVQTGAGTIEIKDVRFTSSEGAVMSALLYIPENASGETPAPAVLAIHGYINSRETQSPYAIELARRGYVVLALDQRGHGYSDPPAFGAGFGGPAGLEYLRSLEMVDTNQIMLSGHSMGGWAVLSAAVANPAGYQAVIVSGSATGLFGVPEGDEKFPRNFAVLYGQFDELSGFMWGVPTARQLPDAEKLQKAFSTQMTVEEEKLYGNISSGTARKLYQPAHTHPANHITHSGIAGVLDWAQTTTSAPNPLPLDDQVWQWKEFGTLLSLLGAFLFLFACGDLGLQLPVFSHIRGRPVGANVGNTGWAWWLSAIVFTTVPALVYFPVVEWASAWPANRWLSQTFTTGFMIWGLVVAVISLGLFLLWHFQLGGKRAGGNLQTYGLCWPQGNTLRNILMSLALAIVVVASLYLLLVLVDLTFHTDFRWWIYALKPMNGMRFGIFLGYVVPFTLFLLAVGTVLHNQMGRGNGSLAKTMVRNACLMGFGILLMLTWLYVPLFTNGALALPDQGLLTIIAIQFLVMLPLAGLISTWFFHKTGYVYLGAFINGLFLTWLIVAGQAIHFPFA